MSQLRSSGVDYPADSPSDTDSAASLNLAALTLSANETTEPLQPLQQQRQQQEPPLPVEEPLPVPPQEAAAPAPQPAPVKAGPKLTGAYNMKESKEVSTTVLRYYNQYSQRWSIYVPYPPYMKDRNIKSQAKVWEKEKTGLTYIVEGVHEYNSVLNAVRRSGFRPVKNYQNAILYWGRPLNCEQFIDAFPTFKLGVKINHFPGSNGLGRKDRLTQNLDKLRIHCRRAGHSQACNFVPASFVIPGERTVLQLYAENNPSYVFILKPVASSCGRGCESHQRTYP